ncbi:MAG: hypothetical protein GYA36_17365 [Veillonellaceae bacterium]|nr:hypothetical protein [Veillonellaceae bacterium]
MPIISFPPMFPGQWGVRGSDAALGLRTLPQSVVYYVDYIHPAADDNNAGTDPALETTPGTTVHGCGLTIANPDV